MGRAARYICHRCERGFTNEFFDNQDPNRLCLFCVVQNNSSTGVSGKDHLQGRIEALNQENKRLREELEKLRNIVHHGGVPRNTMSTPPSHTHAPSSPPCYNTQHQHICHTTPHHHTLQTPTSNRYDALEDEMDGCSEIVDNDPDTIIGDSLVRNIGKFMANSRKTKSTTYVYPGAQIDDIREKVGNFVEPGKNSVMVVNIGSNDVFHRRAASQNIIEKYRELIGTMKDRCSNLAMIGVIPRLYESNFNLSRAIGINDKLSQLCKEAKIGFIDPWLDYVGNKSLYRKDGIHFSYKGTQHLASLISRQISHQKKERQNVHPFH